ncbi:squalene/phytoene synthase family protein [Maritimibacter dapengensis]|uniref:Squalene/phytoene synthase family protein n=1 Tax=Maritimibacter dapengensis TaxID=2836868 RepID=A0ABS6T060_9RHOB|nr:squalene/phytoene synthase family protein [Maritimibacter dapengensis]MBV7378494.1 squalene/phytoene synthase family protein [Maritimibacter dapengensis]
MSVQSCAEMVEANDRDRFASAMTAPVPDREVLFPLYAFNLEVAKAPWLTQEPLIAQMRLQFWRDVLDEVEAGEVPRAHEVALPLAEAIRARHIPLAPLHQMIDARAADIEREPFETPAHLWAYLENTAGALMVAAMAGLGHRAPDQARVLGRAQGLATFLTARRELAALGWVAVDDAMLPGMVETALADLSGLPRRFGEATPAARAASRVPAILKRARGDLDAAPESDAARSFGLAWRTLRGRW